MDNYTAYDERGLVRFNQELESSVEHILKAIRDRGDSPGDICSKYAGIANNMQEICKKYANI